MSSPKITNHRLIELARTYWQWRVLWGTTTTALAVLALFYVLFLKGDTWVASQGIIVRDEANGAVMRLGRFQSQTEMKAAQETILEMARNPQVVSDALSVVGREPGWFGWTSTKPPTSAEIEDLSRSGIQVRAPRGAELGTTEVIYLDVKQSSPERALKLNKAVCDALENRLQQVRKARADGVVEELRTAKETAEQKLAEATREIKKIEAEAGTDLSDLRGLTDSTGTGNSSNRQVLDVIKSEIRQAELTLQQLSTDRQLAVESFENPDELLLTPSTLVNTQAGLKTLRDGLAAATIATSQLRGRYTSTHPRVIASERAEKRIREQLRNELGLSVQSLEKEVELATERVNKLKSQQALLESRLANIAHIRADYSNLAAEVRARSLQLQETERELGLAQASRDAALTSSLITRLDEPVLGEKPLGPGRSTILAGSTVAGLFFGLGVVFLLAPLDSGAHFGRRRFDYSGNVGRRASDREASQSMGLSQAGGSQVGGSQVGGGVLVERRRGNSGPVSVDIPMQLPEWAKPSQMLSRLAEAIEARLPEHQPQGTPADASQSADGLNKPTPASVANASGKNSNRATEAHNREQLT